MKLNTQIHRFRRKRGRGQATHDGLGIEGRLILIQIPRLQRRLLR